MESLCFRWLSGHGRPEWLTETCTMASQLEWLTWQKNMLTLSWPAWNLPCLGTPLCTQFLSMSTRGPAVLAPEKFLKWTVVSQCEQKSGEIKAVLTECDSNWTAILRGGTKLSKLLTFLTILITSARFLGALCKFLLWLQQLLESATLLEKDVSRHLLVVLLLLESATLLRNVVNHRLLILLLLESKTLLAKVVSRHLLVLLLLRDDNIAREGRQPPPVGTAAARVGNIAREGRQVATCWYCC